MSALNHDEIRLIRETHDKVVKLHTVLLGTNGDTGLVGEVREIRLKHEQDKQVCEQERSTIKKHINILCITVAASAGLGVLGGGIYGLLKLLD